MRIKWMTAVLVLAIWATGCKKDEANKDEIGEKLAEVLTVQSGAAAVFAENYSGPDDSVTALDAMGQWIVSQDAVEEAYYIDLNSVEITFKNGLHTSILLTETDAAGQHLTRGGGYGNALTAFKTAGIKKPIKNEKVLVLNPFIKDFYGGSYTKAPKFKLDGQPMEVDVYNGSDVTFGVLNTMDQYGLTILNTHGLTYGFMLYKLFDEPQNPEIKNWGKVEALALLDQSGAVDIGKIANGEVELVLNLLFQREFGNTNVKQYLALAVTTNYIRNSGMDLTDAVVFGNYCYSGYTYEGTGFHNSAAAFRSLNAATFYGYAFESGYSTVVENGFALRMEDSLIANLANVADTTGVAHLAANVTRQYDRVLVSSSQREKIEKGRAIRVAMTSGPNPNYFPFYFNQYFDKNYTYKDCIDSLVDPRDNQVYRTVCIGGVTWMAQNLNYDVTGSVCYDSLPTNCETYGKLYSRAEVLNGQSPQPIDSPGVQGICPQGWHIPSATDWALLEIALGVPSSQAYDITEEKHGEDVEAGSKLMSATGWAPYSGTDGPTADSLNLSGFSALPSGSWTNSALDQFSPPGELSYYWSSTFVANMQDVMIRRLRYRFRGIYVWDDSGIASRYSCRCVQD